MKRPRERNDNGSEITAWIAAGWALLLGAGTVALLLAAGSAPPEREPGTALAHGRAVSTEADALLTGVWNVIGREHRACVVRDTDGDGNDEVLLLDRGDTVQIFDAAGRHLHAIDLDHDARYLDVAVRRHPPALIAAGRSAPIAAYRLDSEPLWTYALSMEHDLTACAVADLDGDRSEEIIAARSDEGLICLNSEGEFKWQLPLPGLIENLAVGDIDGDERQEILVSGHDTPVFVVSAAGHWTATWDIWASACYVAAVDLDGDGTAEIAVKTATFDDADKAFVAGVDSSGNILWRRPVPGLVRTVDRALTAADLDNDGRREWVAVGSDGSLHIIGAGGELLGAQHVGDPIIGVYPMHVKGGVGERLVAVAPTSAKCLAWKGGAPE